MRHAVLGTGNVGRNIGTKLLSLGHEVRLGSRSADNDRAAAWAAEGGASASVGTFADAATWGEVVWLAIGGQHALAVVDAAGAGLSGKVVLDLTNPLDFSNGFPPSLFVSNTDSLGEQIQRAAPEARVVKTFNTLANELMVQPDALPEPTDVFIAGEDETAKATAAEILRSFGHQDPIDMGGIEASRALEAWLLLWTRLYGRLGSPYFNLKLVRGDMDATR